MKKGSSGDDVLGLGSGDDDDGGGDDDGGDDAAVQEESEIETRSGADVHQPLVDETAQGGETIVGQPPHAGAADDGVPWVYTRDNVKQDRDMVQFYLREFVQDAEDDLVDAVSEQLGSDISKTDVREAAYVAAMRDVDAVVDELRDWGFE